MGSDRASLPLSVATLASCTLDTLGDATLARRGDGGVPRVPTKAVALTDGDGAFIVDDVKGRHTLANAEAKAVAPLGLA